MTELYKLITAINENAFAKKYKKVSAEGEIEDSEFDASLKMLEELARATEVKELTLLPDCGLAVKANSSAKFSAKDLIALEEICEAGRIFSKAIIFIKPEGKDLMPCDYEAWIRKHAAGQPQTLSLSHALRGRLSKNPRRPCTWYVEPGICDIIKRVGNDFIRDFWRFYGAGPEYQIKYSAMSQEEADILEIKNRSSNPRVGAAINPFAAAKIYRASKSQEDSIKSISIAESENSQNKDEITDISISVDMHGLEAPPEFFPDREFSADFSYDDAPLNFTGPAGDFKAADFNAEGNLQTEPVAGLKSSANNADAKRVANNADFDYPLLWKAKRSRFSSRFEKMQKKISRLKEAKEKAGYRLVQGKVIDIEERVLPVNEKRKKARVLLKFTVVDKGCGLYCNIWAGLEEKNELLSILKKKNCIFGADLSYDERFKRDTVATVDRIFEAAAPSKLRDTARRKRIELRCLSNMSAKEALPSAAELINFAHDLGHKAIAISDKSVVQGFPEAASAREKIAADDPEFKLIYGMNSPVVDDGPCCAYRAGLEDVGFSRGFVAFDLETTGLVPGEDKICEIGAVKYIKDPEAFGGFKEIDVYQQLINPQRDMPEKVVKLTGLSPLDLLDQPLIAEVLPDFFNFIEDLPLVGHNVFFDLDFLRYAAQDVAEGRPPKRFNPSVVDTLDMSRLALKGLKSHKLSKVATNLGINFVEEDLHRATDDSRLCAMVFMLLLQRTKAETFDQLNRHYGKRSLDESLELAKADKGGDTGQKKSLDDEMIVEDEHAVSSSGMQNYIFDESFLVKDSLGMYNLYRLVSASHLDYLRDEEPLLTKSLVHYFSTGLLRGSGTAKSELYNAALKIYRNSGRNLEHSIGRIEYFNQASRRFYKSFDYVELAPVHSYLPLMEMGNSGISSEEDIKNVHTLLYEIAKAMKLDVAAVSDAKMLRKDGLLYRKILLLEQKLPNFNTAFADYFHTTDEMLEEFSFLPEDAREDLVIDGPERIANKIDCGLLPFPKGTYPPQLEGCEEEISTKCRRKCAELYARSDGGIPELITDRLDRELHAILSNGYAVMYVIASKLVEKSNSDGYVVGSRGSVGSSLAAYFSNITEVNPLPPHYICPECKYCEFDSSGRYGSGFDLPDKSCPECGCELQKEGQDIPFETFLGFDGDKLPDIDLNFSGVYQPRAHAFIEDMFGLESTFRAGTISAYAGKNSLQAVQRYTDQTGEYFSPSDKEAVAFNLRGVKITTGQHPGGIVVVPKDREIYDFTPIQSPANKSDTVITTHFDFNALQETIMKFDILGHDSPTILKICEEISGVPTNDVPCASKEAISLFESNEALNIPDKDFFIKSGTIGLPEVGTFNARNMIEETKPKQFYDLVQLSGLAHGTDVWKNNAQDLIRQGICDIHEVIGCRDSIMTFLIYSGLEKKDSFMIMEKVRKGRGLTAEQEEKMRKCKVPDWYIDSCKKIKYMFPKAHAAAYTISALRIAWYKIHHPEAYYSAHFTVKLNDFKGKLFLKPGKEELYAVCRNKLALNEAKDEQERAAIGKNLDPEDLYDEKKFYLLECVCEMYARGIEFEPVSLENSKAVEFTSNAKGKILPPLNAVEGVSAALAEEIVKAREEAPFTDREDLRKRARLGKTVIESLNDYGVIDHLPLSSQQDFFSVFGDLASDLDDRKM